MQTKAAVFCAGGPAPGFNAVIHGLTSVLTEAGWRVIGLRDGMKFLMEGQLESTALAPELTAAHQNRGGSIIGVSRANPTKDPAKLQTVVRTLIDNRITALVSIGGDDTAKTARAIAAESGGQIRVIHVPKTIDNDLPLPDGMNTFGFTSAVACGAGIIRALLEDSDTTGDRHFVRIIMGRTAGWLAVGTAGETKCPVFIPEEFAQNELTLLNLADLIIGAVIKKEALVLTSQSPLWSPRGAVHIVAEGVFERLSDFEATVRSMFPTQGDLRDEHDHLRFSRIHLQALLDIILSNRLAELGLAKSLKKARGSMSLIVDKLGFELRCIDPIEADRNYALALGSQAGNLLLAGHSSKMVVPTGNNQFGSVEFDAMADASGKTKVRRVTLNNAGYQNLLPLRLLPQDLLAGSPLADAIQTLTGGNAAALSALAAAAQIGARHRLQ